VKFIIDMNLSPGWVAALAPVADSVHWSEIGSPDTPDSEIFHYARKHGYHVFTQDLDFGAILAAARLDRPSVFQLRSMVLDPRIIAPDVLKCIRAVSGELDAGALISFDVQNSRIRKLPLA
jgi:predicted nuclease of predicted toxin-antitoxin system